MIHSFRTLGQPFCHLVEGHKTITLRGDGNGRVAVVALFRLATQRGFHGLLYPGIEERLFGGFQQQQLPLRTRLEIDSPGFVVTLMR